MKLVISGLEHPIYVEAGHPAVLQIENPALFARVCSSLKSGEGRLAQEAYALWEGETELRPETQLMYISDPFDLPWADRALGGEVMRRLERELLADDEIRGRLEELGRTLSSEVLSTSAFLNASYEFAVE